MGARPVIATAVLEVGMWRSAHVHKVTVWSGQEFKVFVSTDQCPSSHIVMVTNGIARDSLLRVR